MAAASIVSQANKHFNHVFNKSFTEDVTKVPEANLQHKLTSNERKQKLRKMHRKIKAAIESQTQANDVEVHYGIRQSGGQYEKQRLATYFEIK